MGRCVARRVSRREKSAPRGWRCDGRERSELFCQSIGRMSCVAASDGLRCLQYGEGREREKLICGEEG